MASVVLIFVKIDRLVYTLKWGARLSLSLSHTHARARARSHKKIGYFIYLLILLLRKERKLTRQTVYV
jgi:hypothetical protein